MTIDVYWGSGSPYSWRVLLALAHKGLEYRSHLLQIAMQEQKSPHMLAMNPRGRVPTLKDGDYVVFESLAVMYYLDRKYPAKPLFGNSPEEGAVIMRVVSKDQELNYSPGTSWYGAYPQYGSFGGYWGYGWGMAYDPGYLRTDTIVMVETLVYSLVQDKLLWAGQSKTTNPTNIKNFIAELSDGAAKEMRKAGFVN
jgi:hypothetical protein